MRYVWIFVLLLAIGSMVIVAVSYSQGNVALITIDNVIDNYEADRIIAEIQEANEKPNIKAILIEINSPGGSVVASRSVAEAVKQSEKPTVCWLRDVATSGAYWVASACDYIVADNFTITGSIGVSASYLEFSKLMEKYGITYVRIVSDEEKDIGSPYRNASELEIAKMQGMVNRIYDAFVNEVAENRNVSPQMIRSLNSSIILGEDAYELGLVDEIGGWQIVEAKLKEYVGEVKLESMEKPLTLQDILRELK